MKQQPEKAHGQNGQNGQRRAPIESDMASFAADVLDETGMCARPDACGSAAPATECCPRPDGSPGSPLRFILTRIRFLLYQKAKLNHGARRVERINPQPQKRHQLRQRPLPWQMSSRLNIRLTN